MTPYELTVLIHHYVSPGLFQFCETDLYKDTCTRFVFDGLFLDSKMDNGYEVTGLGKAWILAILRTPVPKLVYVDAEGKVIEVVK